MISLLTVGLVYVFVKYFVLECSFDFPQALWNFPSAPLFGPPIILYMWKIPFLKPKFSKKKIIWFAFSRTQLQFIFGDHLFLSELFNMFIGCLHVKDLVWKNILSTSSWYTIHTVDENRSPASQSKSQWNSNKYQKKKSWNCFFW